MEMFLEMLLLKGSLDNLTGSLTVSSEGQQLSFLPVTTSGRSDLESSLTLSAESSSFTASGSKTTEFTVLVSWVADPVDSGVVTDGLVHRIDHDHFIPLADGVLGDPVRVQDSEGSHLATDTLFSDGSQVAGGLNGSHTGGRWLAVADTLCNSSLTTTSFDTDTEHNETLLSLVS